MKNKKNTRLYERLFRNDGCPFSYLFQVFYIVLLIEVQKHPYTGRKEQQNKPAYYTITFTGMRRRRRFGIWRTGTCCSAARRDSISGTPCIRSSSTARSATGCSSTRRFPLASFRPFGIKGEIPCHLIPVKIPGGSTGGFLVPSGKGKALPGGLRWFHHFVTIRYVGRRHCGTALTRNTPAAFFIRSAVTSVFDRESGHSQFSSYSSIVKVPVVWSNTKPSPVITSACASKAGDPTVTSPPSPESASWAQTAAGQKLNNKKPKNSRLFSHFLLSSFWYSLSDNGKLIIIIPNKVVDAHSKREPVSRLSVKNHRILLIQRYHSKSESPYRQILRYPHRRIH